VRWAPVRGGLACKTHSWAARAARAARWVTQRRATGGFLRPAASCDRCPCRGACSRVGCAVTARSATRVARRHSATPSPRTTRDRTQQRVLQQIGRSAGVNTASGVAVRCADRRPARVWMVQDVGAHPVCSLRTAHLGRGPGLTPLKLHQFIRDCSSRLRSISHIAQ
jgi:hypothetical protein